VDNTVSAGDTYYYVTTAVNASGLESGYSNQAVAAVP
jgi:fibronectin type 3 domain-containing protein